MKQTKPVTVEEVSAEVVRFWKTFADKSADLENFYSFDARVFGSMATRLELGRSAAVRRIREYFQKGTVLDTRVTGPIEVILLGENAVATYTYEFHVTGARVGLGRIADEHITDGRVTQVFVRDEDGALRIVHEHISQADTWGGKAGSDTRTSAGKGD